MLTTGQTHRADDVLVARLPHTQLVFLGIRNAGRARLTLEEARQLAGALLEVADADYVYQPPGSGASD